MSANIGTIDRIARLVLGLVLIALPFVTGIAALQGALGMTLAVVAGLILVGTAAFKFCPLYRLFGLRTCKI